MNLCVVVPVFNHGLTVARVVSDALRWFPVIAVDDGSTDSTAAALAAVAGIERVTLPVNRGKAAALQAGFERAKALGFTHALTLDADGQHSTAAIPVLAECCQRTPEALIVGVRDLRRAGAPWARRVSNVLSTFWFRMETGVALTDTQCGMRVYPLSVVSGLRIGSAGYAWELEVMVRAAWSGVPLVAQSVGVDYSAATSRMSHFHPVRDFLSITKLHARLALGALMKGRRRPRFGRLTAPGGPTDPEPLSSRRADR
jgi:glycosyltransferase involved in cell wall biosynthesis